MNDFVTKMRLKGLAEEDIWFAKRDRELIEALRRKRLAEEVGCRGGGEQTRAKRFEKEFAAIEKRHSRRRPRFVRACQDLLARIQAACRLFHG